MQRKLGGDNKVKNLTIPSPLHMKLNTLELLIGKKLEIKDTILDALESYLFNIEALVIENVKEHSQKDDLYLCDENHLEEWLAE